MNITPTGLVEIRTLTHEVRMTGDDSSPKITGYASLFDSAYDCGYWTEKVDPHAFDSVIAGSPDVRGLYNHDENLVLGRTTSKTLRLNIDSRGLAYEIDPPATTYAHDLMVVMKREDVNQSSFGFICKRDRWEENPDGTVTRTLLEFENLLDVSVVTFPANPAANSQTRSIPNTMPVEVRSRLFPEAETIRTNAPVKEKRDADACTCGCPQCLSNSCGICSSDPQCINAVRQMRTRIRIARLKG